MRTVEEQRARRKEKYIASLSEISANRVREIFNYDPETGLLTYKVGSRIRPAGATAGSISRDGYWQVAVDGAAYRSHRIIWLYVTGAWPNGHIDHINRQRHDNRWANLRDVSRAENNKNRGPAGSYVPPPEALNKPARGAEPACIVVAVRLTVEQRKAFFELGGAAWIRKAIQDEPYPPQHGSTLST